MERPIVDFQLMSSLSSDDEGIELSEHLKDPETEKEDGEGKVGTKKKPKSQLSRRKCEGKRQSTEYAGLSVDEKQEVGKGISTSTEEMTVVMDETS
jgi:hypothetical protein